MPRNRLPRVIKHYLPSGRSNHGRPLERILDTWDRKRSTSSPTPWQIYDDYWFIYSFILGLKGLLLSSKQLKYMPIKYHSHFTYTPLLTLISHQTAHVSNPIPFLSFDVRHPRCAIQNIINGVKNRRNTTKGILAKMLG
jgi:hypothetical protein